MIGYKNWKNPTTSITTVWQLEAKAKAEVEADAGVEIFVSTVFLFFVFLVLSMVIGFDKYPLEFFVILVFLLT